MAKALEQEAPKDDRRLADNELGYTAAEVREGLADLAEFNRDYDRRADASKADSSDRPA